MTYAQPAEQAVVSEVRARGGGDQLPLAGLLALSTAAFLTIMTEALPAGILPAMSRGLGVTESAAGQTVTVYAVGSLVAAIPLTAATAGWPRKRLLLLALAGFVVANSVTAVSDVFAVTMVARFLGGVVAGLLWAMMAGYARRMAAPHLRGKATAIALAGTPVALSIGVPAGTFLADLVGWRYTFAIMTVLTLVLVVWVLAVVPDFSGQAKRTRMPLRQATTLPGVVPVLVAALGFVLAHNIVYTYIAPLLDGTGLAARVDTVLLVFGVVALASIWITGVLIDRHLRGLVLTSFTLFAVATLGLGLFTGTAWLVYASAALWGLAFGGAGPLLQTAAAEAAGADEAVDVVQSLVVTTWNIGIAAGAVLGGLLLSGIGSAALTWGALVILLIALAVVVTARRHGFPDPTRRSEREPVG
ncbi:MFS transporter [Nocardia fusca]|uniref:MFS transporter n=1 Tax=Nocardia fusca TaxID=941183 RepID=UPI0009FF8A26|nr:MFS transporter [Nocardia fusca]